MIGKTATLYNAYLGYTRILIISKNSYQYECEIIGSGLIIFLYACEFFTDEER